MLQNTYLLAKIGADTAENEQHFAEILPTDALWRLRLGAAGLARGVDERRRDGEEADAGAPDGGNLSVVVDDNILPP